MADVEEPRTPARSPALPMSSERPHSAVGRRVLAIWAVFGALNLVGELVGYDMRQQPWWLRFLALLLALLIAIPVGELIVRGLTRIFRR